MRSVINKSYDVRSKSTRESVSLNAAVYWKASLKFGWGGWRDGTACTVITHVTLDPTYRVSSAYRVAMSITKMKRVRARLKKVEK